MSLLEDKALEELLAKGFTYKETKDQRLAIKGPHKCMMSSETISRLIICGDVGLGETEVITRPAFKVLINMKQVVLLTNPTTILCKQHIEGI